MSKHAIPKSFSKKTAATVSVISLSAASFSAFASPSLATTCSSGGLAGVTATLLAGNVCELVFLPTDSASDGISVAERTWEWQAPAGVTKVSAVIVAAGGASDFDDSYGQDYAAGGDGGDVDYIDDVGTSPLTLFAGLGGFTSGADGYSSIYDGLGIDYEDEANSFFSDALAIAENGYNGYLPLNPEDYFKSGRSQVEPTFDQGSLSEDLPGGVGQTFEDLIDPDTDESATLWTVGNDKVFGQGGAVLFSTNSLSTIGALDGSGQGGAVGNAGATQRGAHGSIILRFSVGSSEPEVEAEPSVSPQETPAAPTPYYGPVPRVLFPGIVDPSTTNNVVLRGERLSTISKAEVNGKEIQVTKATDGEVQLVLPALEPGTYTITYTSASGVLSHQDSLVVRATQTVSTAGNNPFFTAKRFTNYRGDQGAIVAADRRAITAFVKANPGLTQVTCVGSTSGRPALETDQALALSRANNACSIVEELVPGVKTKLVANTGKGVGQFYRAVTIFGKGNKSN